MEFCPECGSMMVPKKSSKSLVFFICPKCQTEIKSSKKKQEKKQSYVLKSYIKHVPSDKLVIEKEEIQTMPTTLVECKKCGNTKAYTWQHSIGVGDDEPEVTFFRCTKCSFTWREL